MSADTLNLALGDLTQCEATLYWLTHRNIEARQYVLTSLANTLNRLTRRLMLAEIELMGLDFTAIAVMQYSNNACLLYNSLCSAKKEICLVPDIIEENMNMIHDWMREDLLASNISETKVREIFLQLQTYYASLEILSDMIEEEE